MNIVNSLALVNPKVSGYAHVSELAKPNSLIYNLNRLTWRIYWFTQPSFEVKDVDSHFRIDSTSGKIYLKQKLDYEVNPSYSLKFKAMGTGVSLPHFEKIENPFEGVGILSRVAEAFRWFERKENTIVDIDLEILVTDEPIYVPYQEVTLDLPWQDLVDAKNKKSYISITTPVKTQGDEAKRFEIGDPDKDIFEIDSQGKLKFCPWKVPDTDFQPVTVSKIKWEHVLGIKVSDADQGESWVEGQVHIYLTISDLPQPAAAGVSFETLVNAAMNMAPPKDLAQLLEIEVPETAEMSLKTISEKIL